MFPSARIQSYFHVLWILVELFDDHGDGWVLFFSVVDEFDGLSFRLGVLGELLEPSSLYEHFDCVLQVDAIVLHMAIKFVEPTPFGFIDSFFSWAGDFRGWTPASFSSATEISPRIFSLDIDRGVYFVKRLLGPLPSQEAFVTTRFPLNLF